MSEKKSRCGIIMPISPTDGCSEAHWADVLGVLNEAIDQSGFEGELVSNSDEVGIIHKRIIQNLYENPVVVCDVSAKNPNVMFELGMRLAFDKPTIIVKDDKTSYSFDTASIEHIEYPRDLRFNKVNDFKKLLTQKITSTYEKSKNDPNYTTFLKHFGEFTIAKLDQKEVTGQEYIIEELKSVRHALHRLERMQSPRSFFGEQLNEKLSGREEDILSLMAEGHTNSSISGHLGLSENTIKTYLYNIYRTLKVHNRLQAIDYYRKYLSKVKNFEEFENKEPEPEPELELER